MFNLSKLSAFLRPPLTPYQVAVRALERGSFERAEVLFTGLLDSSAPPGDQAKVYNKRGIARVHQDRRDEALADFTQALWLQAGFAPALVNIGNLLLEDGALDEAIVHYEAAIRSNDEYAVAHMNLSAAYKKAGRHAESVREFRRAGSVEGRWFQKKNTKG